MRKHTAEKQQLLRRISEQAETVHQLTHHVHLLQAKDEEEQLVAQRTLPVKTSNNFGGSYPIFFKDPPEDDQTRSRSTHPTDSFVTAPWLSETLDDQQLQSHQRHSASRVHDDQSHERLKATEKSFMNRGMSHNTSSSLTQDPLIAMAQSSRHHSFEQPHQTTTTQAYRTPIQSSQPRFATQTEHTLQVDDITLSFPHSCLIRRHTSHQGTLIFDTQLRRRSRSGKRGQ
jgi:hypothetical protein